MKDKVTSITGNFHYLFLNLYLYRRGSLFLPFLGSIFQILLSLITILIPKMLLDFIENKTEWKLILCWIVLSGISLFIVSASSTAVHNEIASCSQGFLFTFLLRKWEEKMMELDYGLFTSHTGKINAEKARNAVSNPNCGVVNYLINLTGLLENAGGFLTCGAIICMLHPFILFLLFLLFGIELWYSLRTETRKQTLKEERASVTRKLNYIAYRTRGIQEGKDIRIYSMVPWLKDKARTAVKDKDRTERSAAYFEMQKMLLNGLLVFLRNGCAYLYLLFAYFHTGMSAGDFTLYFTAITGLSGWLFKLTHTFSAFIETDHYITDFRRFMSLKMDNGIHGFRKNLPSQPVSFVWENVSFSYEQTDAQGNKITVPVLKNINLEIKPGEKLAVVGANGAGKTTFVKLLCGLLKPVEGRILINGTDISVYDPDEYRKLFSAVFQKSGVLPMSIRDNIALNIRSTADEDAIWNCIRLAGLENKIRSLPDGFHTCLLKQITGHGTELSGGELQRLLLARALYKGAPVLILDEPTAALDPLAENEIYRRYNQFSENKTAVFISHRLASTRFCDRILVMDDGGIAEMGRHDELLIQGGKYAEMFDTQSRYYKEVSL